jgi:hypothetical protein
MDCLYETLARTLKHRVLLKVASCCWLADCDSIQRKIGGISWRRNNKKKKQALRPDPEYYRACLAEIVRTVLSH